MKLFLVSLKPFIGGENLVSTMNDKDLFKDKFPNGYNLSAVK